MSRVLFDERGVQLGTFTGPKGVLMWQLTLGREYVQLTDEEITGFVQGLANTVLTEKLRMIQELAAQLKALGR